ncbi:MAG: hypothetical protein ABL908_01585 [Hyphomicrobium sp.]
MYSVMVGVGVIASAIGWYVLSSRASLASAAQSKIDAKQKKRFSRGGASEETENSPDRRPRKRDFGRR